MLFSLSSLRRRVDAVYIPSKKYHRNLCRWAGVIVYTVKAAIHNTKEKVKPTTDRVSSPDTTGAMDSYDVSV